MSFIEQLLIKCDGCGLTKERKDHTMPEGWVRIERFGFEGRPQHWCPTCYSYAQRGITGQRGD